MQLRNGKIIEKTVDSLPSFVKKEDEIYNNENESFDTIYNRVINKHVPYIKEMLYLQSISNIIKEKTKYAFDIYSYLYKWMNDFKKIRITKFIDLCNKIFNQIPVLIEHATLNLMDMKRLEADNFKYDKELGLDTLKVIELLNKFQKKYVYNL